MLYSPLQSSRYFWSALLINPHFLRSSSLYCLRYLPSWYWVLPLQFFLFITSFVLNVLFVLCFICTLHILSYFPYLSSSYFVYVGPEKLWGQKWRNGKTLVRAFARPCACGCLRAWVRGRAGGRREKITGHFEFWIARSVCVVVSWIFFSFCESMESA